MAKPNIYVSPQFLNEFEWQLQRLALMIEMLENFTISARDLHKVLCLLVKEVRVNS